MKKFLAVILALTMVMALVACGGGSSSTGSGDSGTTTTTQPADSGSTDAAPAAEALRVAMISDYGDITDQSFNQFTYLGCKEWAEANDVDFTYFKPVGDSDDDRIATIEQAIDAGYTTLVMPGYAFGPAIAATVNDYPDVNYIAIDVSESDLGAGFAIPANLYTCVYQEELCGYMAGYATVALGYTKLGFLGGMAVPAVVRYGYGWVQGANDAAAETGATVTMNYAYGNQFYGDADITAAMDTWYAAGTEVVFACGGGIYTSAAEAAAKVGGKVVGVDVDQASIIDSYGEGMTLTSAMKALGYATQVKLDEVKAGSFQGGMAATLGLVSADPEENYVGIPMESTQWSDSFTQDDYKAMVADMFSGKLTVSNDITKSANDFATAITLNDLGNIK